MYSISSNDFNEAWAKTLRYLMTQGRIIPAAHDRSILTRDDFVTIELGKLAVNDMLDSKLTEQAPMTDGLQSYINQYVEGSEESVIAILEQPYTYFGRTIDQIRKIQELCLMEQEFNRRITIKTWKAEEDLGAPNPPCLQDITLKRLDNDEVEIYTSWRSHDCYGAWLWNNIAICQYINRELIVPYDLTISKFIETNISLHVYEYDWDVASKVQQLPVAITRRV